MTAVSDTLITLFNSATYTDQAAKEWLCKSASKQLDCHEAQEKLLHWLQTPRHLKGLTSQGARNLRAFSASLHEGSKTAQSRWTFNFFGVSSESVTKRAENLINRARIQTLLEKSKEFPNQLDDAEMHELAALIPDQMHHLSMQERQKWFETFFNPTFLEFLMRWYSQGDKKGVNQELDAFGELCRQAYKCHELYRFLGQVQMRDDVLAVIQLEVEAELHDNVAQSFIDRLLQRRPEITIPLDQNRQSTWVSQENRTKLDNVIADAVLDVVSKRMNHPTQAAIKNTVSQLQEIRTDAKRAILRSLEASPGMKEIRLPIAKSCLHFEKHEKKRLLHKLEVVAKERNKFFEEAKAKYFAVPEEVIQESSRQLSRAKDFIETAQSKGIDETYAFDMVSLMFDQEKSFEASLLSTYLKPLYDEISWVKVSIGFDAAERMNDKEQMHTLRAMQNAKAILGERVTIARLEALTNLVKELRSASITPRLIEQVLQEKSPALTSTQIADFTKRVQLLVNPNDPSKVSAFQKLKNDLYYAITENLQANNELNGKFWLLYPATKAFVDTYEMTVMQPKLTMLENVYQEMPSDVFQDITRKAEILSKIKLAKEKQNMRINIQEIEKGLKDAISIASSKNSNFLQEHKSCRLFQETTK